MKNNNVLGFLLKGLIVILFISCLYMFIKEDSTQTVHNQQSKQVVKSSQKKNKGAHLPKVSATDWQLTLINRENMKEELNPVVVEINGIFIDERIADATAEFLVAAQAIDPQEHLISGYRSVETQTQLYQSYIEQEMASDPSLTPEAAEKRVQAYSQPPKASEHNTGLAIDMGTSDYLNQSYPDSVKQIEKIAPDYGFVLRFQEDKKHSTGVGYEDWHYRYVGKESAKYMTKHNLSLEEYIALLKEKK
ncbi:M15 family metallopeptidase [Streptococcus iniae]|uniref:M15 family metallopeptidase n=1 Tax=Streptococcus iniae TaxID=1346 RepID=UPI002B2AA334|nr:D-alanyl-D-alanine carboxypeptidase family protein [Streptococcus iniae]